MRFKALCISGLIFCAPLQANQTDAAQRIVSLAPSLTELVYSAGAGDKLVGVVNFSDYPPAALQVTNVGSYNAINFEAILQLKPDLILAWKSGNRPQDLDRLQRLGLNLLIRDTQKLDDIPNLIEEIGQRAGTKNPAQTEAQRLRDQLNALRLQYTNSQPVSVFYQVWHQPLITINGEQFISQALQVCGAQNVFADLNALAPHVNREAVIAANPDVILLGGLSDVQSLWLSDWLKVTRLKAVQKNQVFPLNADQFQRPTARLIDGLSELCTRLDQTRTSTRPGVTHRP